MWCSFLIVTKSRDIYTLQVHKKINTDTNEENHKTRKSLFYLNNVTKWDYNNKVCIEFENRILYNKNRMTINQ